MKTGHIVITTRCNMKCEYCYYSIWENRVTHCEMKMQTYCRVLELFSLVGISDINLTGGEPFLTKKIKDYISLAKEKGFNINITTNAMLLDINYIDNLEKLGVNSFAISIDSLIEEEQQTLRKGSNIEHILKMVDYIINSTNIKLSLTTVISNVNYKSLGKLIMYSIKNKIIINIQPVFIDENSNKGLNLNNINKMDSEWGKFRKVLHAWGKAYGSVDYVDKVLFYLENSKVLQQKCNVKNEILVVYPEGNVYPCFFQKDLSLGNIDDDLISEVFLNIQKSTLRNHDCYKDECITCGYKWE